MGLVLLWYVTQRESKAGTASDEIHGHFCVRFCGKLRQCKCRINLPEHVSSYLRDQRHVFVKYFLISFNFQIVC